MKKLALVGHRFGKLLVISESKRPENRKSYLTYWLCRCDCGKEIIVSRETLKAGYNSSCGSPRCLSKIDMMGKTFGRLTVIDFADKPKGVNKRGTYWLCQCRCGNKKIIEGYSLRSGATQSCGCYAREIARSMKVLPVGEASFNKLYRGYINNAKARDYFFDFTKEEFREIIKKPCFYCGSKPYQIAQNEVGSDFCIYNGIDRIDNSRGYVRDNCVPCCGKCNHAKTDLSKDDFLNLVKNIYFHSIIKEDRNE